MSWVKGARARLRQLFRRSAAEERMSEEIRFHIEMETETNLLEGMSPEAARRRALVAFGAAESYRDELRAGRRVPVVEDVLMDARYALRSLRRSPGFAVVSVLTLALAIGAVATMYSVVSGVALRSLPYAEAERLASVRVYPNPDETRATVGGFRGAILSSQSLDLVLSRPGLFSAAVSFYSPGQLVLTGLGEPERMSVFDVPPEFFAVLGVQPRLGRMLTAEDVAEDRDVVVLSHRFWVSRFGRSPDVVGRTLMLDDAIHEVVGVMPSRFDFPVGVQLWRPAPDPLPPFGGPEQPQGRYQMLARLAPGVTLEQAHAVLDEPFAAHARDYASFADWGPVLTPLPQLVVGTARKPLLMLLGAVALVLLIACANVAAVLLSRGVHRQRELAVRRSLGASRWRVIRQLLLEAMLLAVAAGALGILLAYVAMPAAVALIGEQLPRATEIGVDGRVLAAAVVASAITGLLAGLLPALASVSENLTSPLKDGEAGGGVSTWRARAGDGLVVAQVGLGTMVLAAAALLGASFVKLMRIDFGFDPARVLVAELRLGGDRYGEAERQRAFVNDVLERGGALPGAQAVAVSDAIPFAGSIIGSVEVVGRETPEDAPWALFTAVSPDFFQAMGLVLIQGRGFGPTADEAGDVVVNEAFARAFFRGQDPIGQKILFLESMADVEGTISGVVNDARQETLEEPQPEIYYPIPYPMLYRSPKVIVRTTQDPTALAASLRDLIHSVDPLLAIDRLDTMDARVSESIARDRFYAIALAGFSAISLVITALGLYGLTAYTVSRRMREIGIRMALGASGARVRAATIGRTAGLALAGVVLGLAGAAFATRVLEALLYGLSPTDPRVFAGVALVLGAAAVLAAYAPARRAARVDPMVVLRTD